MREKLVVKMLAPKLNVKNSEKGQTVCDLTTNTIYIGSDYMVDGEEFLAHIKSAHCYESVDKYCLKFWTLLHEIGHYKTADLDDEEVENSFTYMLNNVNSNALTYFDSPREWAATEWAINFLCIHPVVSRLLNNFIK